ncbi:MAG: hypothetical protein KKE89_05370, partial [Actinobacteria bacterium]|nr:hypothetical protein [Actinomycetota bacterium]
MHSREVEQVLPDPTGIGRVCMYGQPRLGSDAFVRFMRMLSALALLVAIGGAVILTLQVNEEPQPPQVEFVSGYGP